MPAKGRGAAGSGQKCALVTGGAQGIGLGIAQALAERGYEVAVADIDGEAGRESGFFYVRCDVSREPSVRASVRAVLQRFGRLDALVNNAGLADPAGPPLEKLSLAQWNRRLGVNLTGAFLMAKHCVPHLRKSRGAIVNISSVRALQSEPNNEAYNTSKGGLIALTHALAISLGPQVRVNCVSPGWIDVSQWKKRRARRAAKRSRADHEQHPVGRLGRPEDIAALVAFLLSDTAGFITGQNFIADGGMNKKMIYV
jgi:NAD(P)-dependent dehydrogenase (short-subunit alcohol dehydrogenase family)